MLGFGALPQPPEDKNLSGGYPMDIRIGILSSFDLLFAATVTSQEHNPANGQNVHFPRTHAEAAQDNLRPGLLAGAHLFI